MLKFAGLCSPEQLRTLQEVFDLIWMELRASTISTYNGPSDPDQLRDEIARRVLDEFDSKGKVNADSITKHVLESFGIETDQVRAQSQGSTAAHLKDQCH
jgi:hypothetical protein